MADLGRAALKKASSGRENGEARKQKTVGEDSNADVDKNAPEQTIQSTTAILPRETNEITSIALPDATQLAPDLTSISGNLTTPMGLDASISPDWLNFDTAFENFDAVLGSSGADVSMELLRPFNFDEFGSYGFSN